jgi:hypothetical protein
MSPPSAALVKKFKTLENYATSMHVELLLLNQKQTAKWPKILAEILAIVTEKDTSTNLKDRLTTVHQDLTQNFTDRKISEDPRQHQIDQAFNTRFKKLRALVQACIDEYNPRFSFSNLFTRDRKIDVLLARLQGLSEDSQL